MQQNREGTGCYWSVKFSLMGSKYNCKTKINLFLYYRIWKIPWRKVMSDRGIHKKLLVTQMDLWRICGRK
jgi:hypothetical protein